jgi:hypothetical protein
MHISMEKSQGNSLGSYLKQTKLSFFFLLQNQRLGGWSIRLVETIPGMGEEWIKENGEAGEFK